MTFSLIDSHCHLDFDCFDPDRDAVLARARQQQIKKIIIPGTREPYWARIRRLSQQSGLYACYGLHPYWAAQHHPHDLVKLEQTLHHPRCVAVGECGLDFRSGQADKTLQLEYFVSQLALAQQYSLPVVVHAVRSTETVIKQLKHYPGLDGMIHSFSGSLEQAQQLITMGFYISLGAAVTYEQAKKVRRVARAIPLESLLLETDAPDQPDTMHKGQRNEPAALIHTLQSVAALRDQDAAIIARHTSHNACQLFGLAQVAHAAPDAADEI